MEMVAFPSVSTLQPMTDKAAANLGRRQPNTHHSVTVIVVFR